MKDQGKFTVEYTSSPWKDEIRRIINPAGKSSDWFSEKEIAYMIEGNEIFVSFSDHFKGLKSDKVYSFNMEDFV